MGMMAISQEVVGDEWVMQKCLENGIHIAGLSKIEQAPYSLSRARTLVGIAADVDFIISRDYSFGSC